VLAVVEQSLEEELRAVLRRDDDHVRAGKPVCDYNDPAARTALVDELAPDATALLAKLDACALGEPEPGSVGTGATGPADAPLAVYGLQQPLAFAVNGMMPSLGNGTDGGRQQPPGWNGKVDAVDGDLAGG
jgi:hypothetical protein